MLTYQQCQTVAFYERDSCEFTCPSCLKEAEGSVAVEQLDSGLGRLAGDWTPISSYEMGESDSERVSEEVSERIHEDHFEELRLISEIHGAEFGKRLLWRLEEKLYDELHEIYAEKCGTCDKVLDPQ